MEFIDILGYFGALLIGIILGLIGGGGSILTVPILYYLLAVNPVTATAYSLFVVGTTSLVGALKNIPKKLVDFRTAAVFAIPSFIAVYCVRKFIVPAIPDKILTIGDFVLTKDIGIMLFFAFIMLLAAASMIRDNGKAPEEASEVTYNYTLIVLEGLIIGLLTGLVGAGGGFLIIPALVLMAKLPMKKAVATSLLIIAVKSLIGFVGDIENLEIDWPFLLLFTFFAIAGIWLGIFLANFINGKKLKKAFGWFVLVMAVYIFWKEMG